MSKLDTIFSKSPDIWNKLEDNIYNKEFNIIKQDIDGFSVNKPTYIEWKCSLWVDSNQSIIKFREWSLELKEIWIEINVVWNNITITKQEEEQQKRIYYGSMNNVSSWWSDMLDRWRDYVPEIKENWQIIRIYPDGIEVKKEWVEVSKKAPQAFKEGVFNNDFKNPINSDLIELWVINKKEVKNEMDKKKVW